MYVVFNTCHEDGLTLDQCYEALSDQLGNCWVLRTETMGSSMGYRSCLLDQYRVYNSVREFELQDFYNRRNETVNINPKSDVRASQNA